MSHAWTNAWARIDRADATGTATEAARTVPSQTAREPRREWCPPIAGAVIENRIAVGGTGTVYRARLANGAIAAIKVAFEAAHSRFTPAIFARERALLDRLAHPCIVRALGNGETEDGRQWIATDMVHGSCIDVVCARGSCTDAERIQLVMQVLDALDHAHSNGVVHCDVKPSNVLVDDAGTAVLLDFGASQDLRAPRDRPSQAQGLGDIACTLGWICPEQVDPSSGPIGPAADVYQSALLLYHLLTGTMPYRTESSHPAALLRAALAPERVHASHRRPDLDGSLASLLERALHRDPGRRPPSAREFCLELMDACCVIG